MKKIIGVASCPAGIAHTYMAAEAIELAGRKRGFEVKIETHGAGGVENRLTEEDIRTAEAVILAIDTNTSKEKFRNLPLIEVSVGYAIRNADKIIQKVVDNELTKY
ncbi:MAG: PTS fructose transporter subunit IIB [Clostridiaceae bacterium]